MSDSKNSLAKLRNYYRDDFINYLFVERNLSSRTLKEYGHDLKIFFDYFEPHLNEELTLDTIDERTIREFLTYLRIKLKYSAKGVNRKLASLKSYFHFLKKEGYILKSPVEEVKGAKLEKHLPKVLDEDDVAHLIEVAESVSDLKSELEYDGDDNYKKFVYVRDYAIMELFYASGMRISELTGLDIGDIDFKSNMIKVTGKGNKQRVVLINEACASAIYMYLSVRPEVKTNALFLNRNKTRLSVRAVQIMFRKTMLRAGIAKNASPHTMRHSFATHLLKGGSDLVTIKELLGHENLATTQIYTNITMQHIQETYNKSHPRAGDN